MDILRKSEGTLEDNIDQYLDLYINKIKNYKDHVSLKGKNIEQANVEQAAYLAYYDEIKVEVKAILDKFKRRAAEVKSIAWKNLLDHSKLSHTDKEKEILINSNPTYLKIMDKLSHVQELYDILESICEQFKSRGYSLNNITRIRVASLEDVTLYE